MGRVVTISLTNPDPSAGLPSLCGAETMRLDDHVLGPSRQVRAPGGMSRI